MKEGLALSLKLSKQTINSAEFILYFSLLVMEFCLVLPPILCLFPTMFIRKISFITVTIDSQTPGNSVDPDRLASEEAS